MEVFFEKSKLPLALYRLGPRRFCARGSFSEYAWRIGNFVCNIYILIVCRVRRLHVTYEQCLYDIIPVLNTPFTGDT